MYIDNYYYGHSMFALKNIAETFLEPHSVRVFASTSRFPDASASAFDCQILGKHIRHYHDNM